MNAAAPHSIPPPPAPGIDFTSLPWNLNLPNEHCYVHITTTDVWNDATHYALLDRSVYQYSERPLPMAPATTSLNYGTTLWEGLKAYRTADQAAVVFRADRNYERMKAGAAELCLPMPSKRVFMRAVQVAIQRNASLLPPPGGGMKLYVRPMLLGTGQQLGLYPSSQFSFVVYVSPTGNYFKSATTGLNLHLETRRARASRGGMGAVKCAGNYAAALKPLMDCKRHGFVDNIFLELETFGSDLNQAVLQEMSAANVFLVLRSGEIVTPSLERATILPGVTRDSVLQLIATCAAELHTAMQQSTGQSSVSCTARDVTVAELHDATEAFATGTAAEVVPIARLATAPGEVEQDVDVTFPHGQHLPGGPVTAKLLDMLRQVMVGQRVVGDDWLRDPFADADEFCR